jgi:hypothetical protein
VASVRTREPPAGALPREDTRLVPVRDPLVLTEQVADLAGADSDVAGGDVRVLAEVAVQLGHEALAEPHDLVVGASLRVEVGTALPAADRHARQRVLEDLLEAEELHDPEVHRGMEPEPALVRAEGAVELDAKATVDVDLPAVVLPRDAEDDLALRLADPLDDLVAGQLGMLGDHRTERLEDLLDRLVELRLRRAPARHVVVHLIELLVEHRDTLAAAAAAANLRQPCRTGSVRSAAPRSRSG